MIKRLLIAAIFATGFALPATADEGAVKDVIAGQLDAFQRDDFVEAFNYASPFIKRVFRNPAQFGAMVKQGYPMVYRPSGVSFGEFSERGNRSYQLVTFADNSGQAYVAEYEMLELNDVWLINGVRLIERLGFGA